MLLCEKYNLYTSLIVVLLLFLYGANMILSICGLLLKNPGCMSVNPYVWWFKESRKKYKNTFVLFDRPHVRPFKAR